MIKRELIAAVAEKENCTLQQASTIVEATIKEIKRQVKGGNEVVIRGFGTFRSVLRKEKIARHIRANKSIVVPEHVTPVFRASKHF